MSQDDLIFDVGMHHGEDTAYYLHRGYRVVGIEANPVLADEVGAALAGAVEKGRLVIEKVGIAAERGTATFWVNDKKSEWSAFDKALGCRLGTPCHSIEVTCVRFADLIEKHGVPHYVKIDIEGHDRLCLEGLTPDTAPAYLSTETATIEHIDVLRDLGYTGFKCINQRNHNDPEAQHASYTGIAPRVRREVRRFTERLRRWVGRATKPGLQPDGSWRFASGSSGPFGEDTPGPWLSYEEARARYAAWQDGAGPLNPRGWYDVHVRR